MNAFEAGVNVLHSDPNLSVSGTFTPVVGSPVDVRVIVSRADEPASVGPGPGVRNPGLFAVLRQSEVETRPTVGDGPADADQLTIEATEYFIRDVEEDVERLTWRCELGEVA